MLKDIDIGNGRVVLDDLHMDPNVPLKDQIWDLKEDILQIEYPDDWILDVGWYPEFNHEGRFRIYVIKDHDWWRPFYVVSCRSLQQLTIHVRRCARFLVCITKNHAYSTPNR